MLVLSRRSGQRIQIGNDVIVTVLGVRGGTVRLGFEGPSDVPIHREEIYRRICREKKSLLTPETPEKKLKAG